MKTLHSMSNVLQPALRSAPCSFQRSQSIRNSNRVLRFIEELHIANPAHGDHRGILSLHLTRPTFLYQSKLEILAVNSPLTPIRRGFRVLQRLDKEALECAPPPMY
jgi:hypothetical protein